MNQTTDTVEYVYTADCPDWCTHAGNRMHIIDGDDDEFEFGDDLIVVHSSGDTIIEGTAADVSLRREDVFRDRERVSVGQVAVSFDAENVELTSHQARAVAAALTEAASRLDGLS